METVGRVQKPLDLITHKNNYHGQIDYIRGLQDEVWDLPAGTGMDLR